MANAGWKISRTSFDVISWMLREPDGCPLRARFTRAEGRGQRSERSAYPGIVQRSKCVLNSIATIVGAQPAALDNVSSKTAVQSSN
jgi:hypothetical protein